MRRAVVLLLTPLLILSACVGATCGCITEVRVFGAASLANVLDEFKDSFSEERRPAAFVTVTTGSSTALRTQIEEGARADVYLSADTANPQALFDQGLTDGRPLAFTTNRLTIIVPRGNPGDIRSPADLAQAGLTIIAAADEVPITKYAQQVVTNLAALPGYPTDFAAAYESNIRSREDNVGAVVAKVALGEGDAAIVYATDSHSAAVDTIDIPRDANVTATYSGVVLKDAPSPIAADAFLDWIRGPSGQYILRQHGFLPQP